MTRGLAPYLLTCFVVTLPLYGYGWGVLGMLGLVVIALTPAVGRRVER